MPDINVPQIDINKAAADLNNAVKEGAYIAVGLGVLGFQRAQVRRVELTKQIESQLKELPNLPGLGQQFGEQFTQQASQQIQQISEQFSSASKLFEAQVEALRAQLGELAKVVDDRVQPARKQLDEQFDRLEQLLPAAARDVVQSVRSAATTQEHMIRTAVGLS